MYFADVVLPIPIDKALTYRVPAGEKLNITSRVLVPLGKRKVTGLVIKIHTTKPAFAAKEIEKILDPEPVVSPLFLEWLIWASRYYITPLGEVLASALPPQFLGPSSPAKIGQRKSKKALFAGHWTVEKEVTLDPAQLEILDSLLTLDKKQVFAPALIYGVTGSGKTEVYLRFIEALVRQKKQVIFLVPEIGLTPQVVARFGRYFGNELSLYHSGLTDNQRLREWFRARNGESFVTIGTRSALFMPYEKLGGIIIDEEQDASYKQEERFRYNARDLAMVRGKMAGCTVLLGSATPSLETFHNAKKGKYHLFRLSKRACDAQKPHIKLVDMSAEKRQTGSPLALSRELVSAIGENLEKKEQTMVLINRRGFARSLLCLQCEKSVVCSNCSVNMIFHKKEGGLLCHYCDESVTLPEKCPYCGGSEVMLTGIGAETVEEELKTIFSRARVARLDRDAVRKSGLLLKTLDDLRSHRVDILVGTQMIAKGHDVPNVTLVGVLEISAGLGIPDFRASERVFQLLVQVAGRSGRGKIPGKVIVQSYAPNHYSTQLACREDYEAFFEKELSFRQELGYPPDGRIIQIRLSSASEKRMKSLAKNLEKALAPDILGKSTSGVLVLGPAPAPLQKLRGRFRWNLTLRGKNISQLRNTAMQVLDILGRLKPAGVKWAVDVDPVGML